MLLVVASIDNKASKEYVQYFYTYYCTYYTYLILYVEEETQRRHAASLGPFMCQFFFWCSCVFVGVGRRPGLSPPSPPPQEEADVPGRRAVNRPRRREVGGGKEGQLLLPSQTERCCAED